MAIMLRLRLAWQVLTGLPLLGEGETTSPEVASIASRGLARPLALSKREIRAVCASALTQARNREQVK
jgi:hypothetical protein